jgi:endonuclease/exonuclease/phosphatase family metal-dependent hydrolase
MPCGDVTWLSSIYLNASPAERGEDINFIESEPDFIHKNFILGGDFNCIADTNLDTKTIRGTGDPRYSNAHSARW